MTWSEVFRVYIQERFGEDAQEKAARWLKVSPASVSYWCRGKTPRDKMRAKIERRSGGRVPATLHVVALPATGTG